MEQTRLLEMIATGVALQTCLSELTVAATRIDPAVRAGVVLASADRRRIQSLHSARLPASFGLAVHGAPVNDLKFGTCGTAIHTTCPCATRSRQGRCASMTSRSIRAHNARIRGPPIRGNCREMQAEMAFSSVFSSNGPYFFRT